MKDTTVSGTITTKPIKLSTDRPLKLNVEIPKDTKAVVDVEVIRSDGTQYESTRVTEGGTSVSVSLQKPPLQEPIRLRLTLRGEVAPDSVPRLFAIEY